MEHQYGIALVFTMTGHTWGVSSLVTLSNGNLASGSGDDTVKIWNTKSGLLVYTLTGHIWGVYTLVTLRNRNLASGSHDILSRYGIPIKEPY